MDDTTSFVWGGGSSSITAQRRRYLSGSKTLPKDGTQEAVHREEGRSAVGMGRDVGAGQERGAWTLPAERNGSPGERRRPGMDFRVCQHVERFVKETGQSMEEGRHLAQLLQLEFRDVVRRGEEMEAEAACLRRRIGQMENYRREKDAIDRGSFAGMVSAHSDASAELRSRLEKADRQIEGLEVEKQGLVDELNAKEGSIMELQRKLARLVTSARVEHETANRARHIWEQRISAKWEAYWSNRCRRGLTSAEDPSTAWKRRSETNPEAAAGVAAAVGAARAAYPLVSKGIIPATLQGGHALGEDEGQRSLAVSQEERLEEQAAVTARAAASSFCSRCRCRCRCRCCPCHSCCYGQVDSKTSRARNTCGSATPSEAHTTSTGASHRRAKHWSDLTALSSVSRTSRSSRHGAAPLGAQSDEGEEDRKEEGEGEYFSEPVSGAKCSSGGCDRPVEKQRDSATVKRWSGSSDWDSAPATVRYELTSRKGERDGSQLRTSHLKGTDCNVRREGTRWMITSPSSTSRISPVSMVPLLIPGDTGSENYGVSGGGAHELADCRADSEDIGRKIAASTVAPLGKYRVERDRIVSDEASGTRRSRHCSRFERGHCVDNIGGVGAQASDMPQQQLGRMSPALRQQQQQQQQQPGGDFETWTRPASSDAVQTAGRQGRPHGTGSRHNVYKQDTHRTASTKNKLRTPTTASVTATTSDTLRRQRRSPRAAFDRQRERVKEGAERGASGGREGQEWQSAKELTTAPTASAAGSDRRGSPRAGGVPDFGGTSTAPAGLGADEHRPWRTRQRQECRQGRGKGEFVTAAEVAAAAAAAVVTFGANQSEDAMGSSPVSHCSRRQEEEGGQKQRQRRQQQSQQQQQQQQQQHWLEDHHQHSFCRQQQSHREREHEQHPSPLSSLSWATPIEYAPRSDSRCAPSRRIDPETAVATGPIDPLGSRQAFSLHDTASSRSQSRYSDLSTSGSSCSSSSGPVEPQPTRRHRHRHRHRQQRKHATGHGDYTAPAAHPSSFSASESDRAPVGKAAVSAPIPGPVDDDVTTDHSSRRSTESEFSGGLYAPSGRSDPTASGGSSSGFARGRSPAPPATRTAAAAGSLTTGSSSSRWSYRSSGGGSNGFSYGRTGRASGAACTAERWSTRSTSAFVPGNRSGSSLASNSGWIPASSSANSRRVSSGAGRGDDGDDHADGDGGGGVHRDILGDDARRGGCHGYLDVLDRTSTWQAGRYPVKSNSTLLPAARGRAMIEAR